MFLEISLVLVSVLFVTSCYVIWNITTKLEALEDWVTDFINTVINQLNRFKGEQQ